MSMENTRATPEQMGGIVEDEVYSVTHENEHESLSTTVTLAVCEVAGVEPVDFQLYQYIDPDALDELFSPVEDAARERGRVELVALGHRVTVTGGGTVTVRRADGAPPDGE